LSGAVQLVQGEGDNADKLGLLLFRPVYRGNGQPDTVAARLDAILGWVYAPFWIDDFVEDVAGSRVGSFRIDDITEGTPTRLFTRQQAHDGRAAFSNVVEFDNYGRRWRIVFDSPPLAQAAPSLNSL